MNRPLILLIAVGSTFGLAADALLGAGPRYVDANGDGICDNRAGSVNPDARDADGDGIPNGQDADYTRPRDGRGRGMGRGNAFSGGRGRCCGCGGGAARATSRPSGPGFGRGMGAGQRMGPGMSDAEHQPIWELLSGHAGIRRTIRELPDGVETRTTTETPALVKLLRVHVRQMAKRVDENRPVRLWDPVFRDVFDHADAIRIEVTDIEGGVLVKETSEQPDVVPIIKAHAKAVSGFVAGGHASARPEWAGRGGRNRGGAAASRSR